jgi:hypothetical protein
VLTAVLKQVLEVVLLREVPTSCIDQTVDVLLPDLAATALDGAKGVGKTATARPRISDVRARRRCTGAREVDLVVTGPDGIGVVPLALLGP